MTNLLAETELWLTQLKKTPKDIAWVGNASGTLTISWKQFQKIASQVEYNSGFGSQQIASDLVIVFRDNSWMSRTEYDGAEDWTFNRTPVIKPDASMFTRVKGSYCTLAQCQDAFNDE